MFYNHPFPHIAAFISIQDMDSEDEWQSLIEVTDQEGNPETALTMLGNTTLIDKLKNRLDSSASQVLDGMLEGAARLRSVLRVITNLVTLKWCIQSFSFFGIYSQI